MNDNRSQNRRSEPRYYFRSGERMFWRSDQPATRSRKGWLQNVSKNGAAFLMQGGRIPDVGDDIELLCDECKGHVYEVVRIVGHDRGVVLVGCQHSPAEPLAVVINAPPRINVALRLPN